MDGYIEMVADYLSELFVERLIELIVAVVIIALWRWLIGKNIKKSSTSQIIMEPGSTYNDFRSENGQYHINFAGKGRMTSPIPIRIKQVEMHARSGLPEVHATVRAISAAAKGGLND